MLPIWLQSSLVSLFDHPVGLMTKLCGQLAMGSHGLAHGNCLLAVACRMRGNLRCLMSLKAASFQISPNLLAARAGGIEILLRVSLDFRSPAPARCDLVSKRAEPVGELRLVDRRGKLLGLKQSPLLQSARLAILALGDVEDHGVGMKLRSRIAIDGTGSVMLELGDYKCSCGFCRTIPAKPRLGVPLQLAESCIHSCTVGLADAVISAHERGQRHRLWSRKCGI